LTVATSDPFDYEALEEIQLAVDQRVEMVLAPRSQILRTIHDVLYREPAPAPVKEKSKDQLLSDLESSEKPSREGWPDSLIPLLIAKGVSTQDELVRKAKELEAVRER